MSNAESITVTTNEKREYWLSQIKQWEGSKLSQRVYCQQAAINYTTFVYWKSNLKAKASDKKKMNFTPVKVISSSLSNSETPRPIQVKLVTGHVVYIPATMDTKDIATLIHLLGKDNA
jgi:hypothetical protein